MKRDLVAGIDSSTQSCTVMLRSLVSGDVIALARKQHPTTTPPCSEQEPQAWWEALTAALGELRAWWPRIAGLAVGGQGHGLVMLDKNDRPLRPAKLWNDTESAPQAYDLCRKFAPEEWARLTGSVPGPAMTISKLAWTEQNCPGLLEKCHRIMLPFDYLVYRLSGSFVCERGGASGTGYFNPFTNSWEPQLASVVNSQIDWLSRWPAIIPSHQPAGVVKLIPGLEDLAGAVVGVGTGDNMSAALGMNLKPGDTGISIGTSGTLYGITPTGIADRTGTINGYADATDRFIPMITTLNSAKVTDTFRNLLGVTTDEFDTLALSSPAGANGLQLVPWLDGERTPNLPDATGHMCGLRTTTTRQDMARAAVEGVLCGLLAGGLILKQHGLTDEGHIVVTGGGAKSRAYRQILADLTGKPVWISPVEETAAAGAGIQAAAAVLECTNAEMAERWSRPFVKVADPQEDARHVLDAYLNYANALSGELQ
ncbi:xylulokinase (plasmid) [Erwinia persicina]|uniref:xylulokinase n=1 Tax=Erwinia persicina TaxID=55211 RepID=UPI000E4A396E|nr:xylulokinase [Erwinia persicina]AXU98034.1 xylulokinase [Erwinia persicina]